MASLSEPMPTAPGVPYLVLHNDKVLLHGGLAVLLILTLGCLA